MTLTEKQRIEIRKALAVEATVERALDAIEKALAAAAEPVLPPKPFEGVFTDWDGEKFGLTGEIRQPRENDGKDWFWSPEAGRPMRASRANREPCWILTKMPDTAPDGQQFAEPAEYRKLKHGESGVLPNGQSVERLICGVESQKYYWVTKPIPKPLSAFEKWADERTFNGHDRVRAAAAWNACREKFLRRLVERGVLSTDGSVYKELEELKANA